MLAVPFAPTVSLRLYDTRGQILASSPNADAAPSVQPLAVTAQNSPTPLGPLSWLMPSFAPEGTSHGTLSVASDAEGGRWRIFLRPTAPDRILVAAAPLDRVETLIEAFRWLVLLLAALGAGTTLAAAWLVAGRALDPVRRLTETAAGIAQAGAFGRRVPMPRGRDEFRALATTFNEMLTSLERAYEAQKRFVADASHELRAPLTAIQANLELLDRQQHMPPSAQRECVVEARREAGRLATLVADLLALARADAGAVSRQVPVELDRVTLDVVSEARHLANGHRIEVTDMTPTIVRGDPDRLKQLLLILLDNAVKYTQSGGRVSLSLRHDDGWVRFKVADTGMGISPEDLPLVFERFYRADPARARDPGGTGLGLPIARWIAEQHAGTISITSQPDRGTTVTVELPIVRKHGPALPV